jgi:hypothetical protein
MKIIVWLLRRWFDVTVKGKEITKRGKGVTVLEGIVGSA